MATKERSDAHGKETRQRRGQHSQSLRRSLGGSLHRILSQPKTGNSIREVSIPQDAVELLKQEHAKHPSNPWMFPSGRTGEMYHVPMGHELAVGGKAADCQPMWVTVWVRVSSHIRLETCFMKSVSSTESN